MSKEITIKPIADTNKVPIPKIVNSINTNAYGILLHTRKSIEEFQLNSGMEGKYTKEYQHHYWAANARLAVDGQVLDISIPLVLFNYEQEITRGDIKFDLVEVEKISNTLEKVAIAKFKELQATKIYKYITKELGITDWTIIPLNTAHVHPGGERQSFSSIDLRKDINYPGVVYPLTKGVNIPSFSAIMAHIDGVCRTVHSEYRLFNEAKNSDKIYAHGRCSTIVKGFIPEPLPRVAIPEKIEAKMIDKIFNIIPEQPKREKQKEALKRPNFILRDKMEKNDGEEFLKGIEKAWIETKYDPDTTMIIKENIKEVKPNYYGQVNQNLWNNQKKQGERDAKKSGDYVSLFDQKAAIVKHQLASWHELQGQTDKDVKDLYTMVLDIEKEIEEQEAADEELDRPVIQKFLLSLGYKIDILVSCTNARLQELWEKERYKEEEEELTIFYEGKTYSVDEIAKLRILLEEEKYLSFAKINQMSDYNIISYYVKFNVEKGE